MKRAVRRFVVRALYGSGVLDLWARLALRRRAVVLMYHRVLSADEKNATWSHPAIVVSEETFDRHLAVLRRLFRVLSPHEFMEAFNRGRFQPRSCLVTFDDGWIDTYTRAWPLMKRYQVPALVFLPSAYVGTGEVFWQERLGHLLHVTWTRCATDPSWRERVRPVLERFGLERVLDLPRGDAKAGILAAVRGRKTNGSTDPTAPVRALLDVLRLKPSDVDGIDRFIDWRHAREMMTDGVTFGAHSHSHRRLTTLTPDDVCREVEQSRDILAASLGAPISAFCYPNGDWNTQVAGSVEAAGFSLAFSTDRGQVGADANRWAIRRVNIHEDMTGEPSMFLARILGIV